MPDNNKNGVEDSFENSNGEWYAKNPSAVKPTSSTEVNPTNPVPGGMPAGDSDYDLNRENSHGYD